MREKETDTAGRMREREKREDQTRGTPTSRSFVCMFRTVVVLVKRHTERHTRRVGGKEKHRANGMRKKLAQVGSDSLCLFLSLSLYLPSFLVQLLYNCTTATCLPVLLLLFFPCSKSARQVILVSESDGVIPCWSFPKRQTAAAVGTRDSNRCLHSTTTKTNNKNNMRREMSRRISRRVGNKS